MHPMSWWIRGLLPRDAQALNFLILVWLLKRFLYQPVLDAIRTREQRIAMQLADAASKEAAATKEREEFARKNADRDSEIRNGSSKNRRNSAVATTQTVWLPISM